MAAGRPPAVSRGRDRRRLAREKSVVANPAGSAADSTSRRSASSVGQAAARNAARSSAGRARAAWYSASICCQRSGVIAARRPSRVRATPSPAASRASPCRATRSSTAAVSSTLSPPKNRISMTRLFRSSNFASASSASSSATSSCPGSCADGQRLVERHSGGQPAALRGTARARVVHEDPPHDPGATAQRNARGPAAERPSRRRAAGTPR